MFRPEPIYCQSDLYATGIAENIVKMITLCTDFKPKWQQISTGNDKIGELTNIYVASKDFLFSRFTDLLWIQIRSSEEGPC